MRRCSGTLRGRREGIQASSQGTAPREHCSSDRWRTGGRRSGDRAGRRPRSRSRGCREARWQGGTRAERAADARGSDEHRHEPAVAAEHTCGRCAAPPSDEVLERPGTGRQRRRRHTGTLHALGHDRRVARRRYRRAVGRSRMKALGLTLSVVMVLIAGVALFTTLDPSPSSGESGPSASDGSLPPSAVDGSVSSLQDQRLDALPRQREPGRRRQAQAPAIRFRPSGSPSAYKPSRGAGATEPQHHPGDHDGRRVQRHDDRRARRRIADKVQAGGFKRFRRQRHYSARDVARPVHAGRRARRARGRRCCTSSHARPDRR